MNGTSDNRARLIFVGAILVAAAVALVIVLLSGGSDKKSSSSASCTPNSPQATTIKLPCPPTTAPPAGTTATVSTSEGDFTIALATDKAPLTTASFVYMSQHGVYDHNSITRIAPDFVIQGGDPAGTGAGDAGFTVVEAPPADTKYTPGVVAMAKSGTQPAGASGSQFFVVDGTGGATLPAEYALLGNVTSGMDIVQKIASIGTATGSDGPPKSPIAITGVKISSPQAG